LVWFEEAGAKAPAFFHLRELSAKGETGMIPDKARLKEIIQQRIAEVRAGAPGQLSPDGTALCVAGSLGCDCYVTPEGEAFIETYDLGDASPPVPDRSRRGQIAALVFGSQNFPDLAAILPAPTADAISCRRCEGSGYMTVGPIKGFLLCTECCGLGWTSPLVFHEETAPPDV